MKALNEWKESRFLRLFFFLVSLFFIIGAVIVPDRTQMFTGLWKIITNPCRIATNYFDLGGYSGTFLNMGLVGLVCTALFFLPGAVANNVSTLAVILTIGFCTWGTNILNIWFTISGVVIYTLIKKQPLGSSANAMMFSTGVTPLISELLLRYPGTEIGFTITGLFLALGAGIAFGMILPPQLAHSPLCHKGFDHYSAALPVGFMAFLFQGILFKSTGVTPADVLTDISVASAPIVNIFCIILFGSAIILAVAMGYTPRQYLEILNDSGKGVSFSSKYGNAALAMNFGIYGLFILAYYNLVGASFNGVTFGIMFCMLSCCNSGSHPRNVLPIMLGYVCASWIWSWLSGLTGGNFTGAINAQPILIGLCFASGLSAISGTYGWIFGFVAAMGHYCMVTTTPSLHAGFCLYNGGFTAGMLCIILIPFLESLFKTKEERKQQQIKA